MNLFRYFLCFVLLIMSLESSASGLMQFGLSETSFSTNNGYKVSVGNDDAGHITFLRLSKHRKKVQVPVAAYKDIIGAALNEIRLYEDVRVDHIILEIPAYTYDTETGGPTTRVVHRLDFEDFHFNPADSSIEPSDINLRGCYN